MSFPACVQILWSVGVRIIIINRDVNFAYSVMFIFAM